MPVTSGFMSMSEADQRLTVLPSGAAEPATAGRRWSGARALDTARCVETGFDCSVCARTRQGRVPVCERRSPPLLPWLWPAAASAKASRHGRQAQRVTADAADPWRLFDTRPCPEDVASIVKVAALGCWSAAS